MASDPWLHSRILYSVCHYILNYRFDKLKIQIGLKLKFYRFREMRVVSWLNDWVTFKYKIC